MIRILAMPRVELGLGVESPIEQDGDRKQKSFGKNVKAWMAKMMVKAMDGAWEVAEDTAPAPLKAALSRFYGWD